jgi:hypothetical protein
MKGAKCKVQGASSTEDSSTLHIRLVHLFCIERLVVVLDEISELRRTVQNLDGHMTAATEAGALQGSIAISPLEPPCHHITIYDKFEVNASQRNIKE